mmetsp:Transcript_16046/g.31956  ORF Transcript_16046/g.31956 Transcript_16046/m.31956 type:complete len:268 (+) Transcript_16046:433-1236(+)
MVQARPKQTRKIYGADIDDESLFKSLTSGHRAEKSDLLKRSLAGDMPLGEGSDLGERLKVQHVLASRHERVGRWVEICAAMNTTEVEEGSMWSRDRSDLTPAHRSAFEVRYLIKWDGLSYLHCSWETRADIAGESENGEVCLQEFDKKGDGTVLFGAEERRGGMYFDPRFIMMERILELDDNNGKPEPLVIDKHNGKYSEGRGRRFLIKWRGKPYCEATYEYERDLVVKKVAYKMHVQDYLKWSKKVYRPFKAMRSSNVLNLNNISI